MIYGKSHGKEQAIKERRFPKITESEIIRGLLSAATSFLLGICPLPMSVYPLGIAFFCAASSSVPYAFAGLTVSCFFTNLNPFAYLVSVFLALFIRVLVRIFIDAPPDSRDTDEDVPFMLRIRENLFCEALSLRAACAAVSAFALSLYSIVSGGFRYYDLFGAIFAIGVGALGVLLFNGALEQSENKWAEIYSKSARLAISALICLSLSSLPVRGFEPALTAAFIFTLSFCLSDGLVGAGLCAFLCGAVCGAEDIAVLIIAAFTAYCVLDLSPSLAAAVACIAGSICGVLISGSTYMTSPFLSLLFGCTLYSTQKKLSANKSIAKRQEALKDTDIISQLRSDKNEALFKQTENTFHSLAECAPCMECAESLILSLKREYADESEENPELARVLSHRLFELGFGKTEVNAIGKRELKIIIRGERVVGKRERTELIRKQVEDITGLSFSAPTASKDGRTLTLCRESAISYHHSLHQSAKEDICGDTAEVFFDQSRNYLYALICDGMGSGGAANAVSSRAASILKALLLGGLEIEKSTEELAWLLPESQTPSDEISTTVDLMRIDLYTGEGILIKSGAAPSYIKHGNKTLCLDAHTVPMGILNINDAQKIKFSAQENDVIIMTSDGVAECQADSTQLLEYLDTHTASAPKEMATDITELSRANGRTDDVSVIVIKIFSENY